MVDIPETVIVAIKNTAKKLSGSRRRGFIAEITMDLLDGNARKAERIFGWGRETVIKGMRELTTGIECIDNYSARGKKRTEDKYPQLAEDIRRIFNGKGNLKPSYIPFFNHGKITSGAVRQTLIDRMGYKDEELPNVSTIGNILARLGYRSRGGQASQLRGADRREIEDSKK